MTDTADEFRLIAALRAGDQTASATLVEQHTPALLRVARGYLLNQRLAEELVQATWIHLIKGSHEFQGRTTLRTWLFTVMFDIASSQGIHERWEGDDLTENSRASVSPDRFYGSGQPNAGSWKVAPAPFPDCPEGSVLATELRDVAQRQVDELPRRQRTVVTLRDMLGFDSAEVCELLKISVDDQRVLLHRGRSAIRQALEDHVREHVSPQGG